MKSFHTRPMPRIFYGNGSVAELTAIVRSMELDRILIVSDNGIRDAGHLERVAALVRESAGGVTVYDEVNENPTTLDAADCAAVARAARVQAIVGVGGGSSLDTAKACNFLVTQGGEMRDFQGFGKASRPMLPFVAVPTTAGTGSECQSYALIGDPNTHEKMACGDLKAMARTVILDPDLTESQPFRVAACSGIDALAHALESAVALNGNAFSETFASRAFGLLESGIPVVFNDSPEPGGRRSMLLGASFAGLAIENSMLGSAHAGANPLTAEFGVTHGHAVGLLLPHVIRFNAAVPSAAEVYARLARETRVAREDDQLDVAVERLRQRVEELYSLSGLPRRLSDCGVSAGDIEKLATKAAEQWTARFNPRPAEVKDFIELYSAAF